MLNYFLKDNRNQPEILLILIQDIKPKQIITKYMVVL